MIMNIIKSVNVNLVLCLSNNAMCNGLHQKRLRYVRLAVWHCAVHGMSNTPAKRSIATRESQSNNKKMGDTQVLNWKNYVLLGFNGDLRGIV